jgi:eukaryotic-like serine/threonine-protein kinase
VAPLAASPRGDGGGNRQLLIMLAVVLGVLVLLCAGVISYLVSRNTANGLGGTSSGMVTSVNQMPAYDDEPAGAPYRRGDDRMTEGRLTR